MHVGASVQTKLNSQGSDYPESLKCFDQLPLSFLYIMLWQSSSTATIMLFYRSIFEVPNELDWGSYSVLSRGLQLHVAE